MAIDKIHADYGPIDEQKRRLDQHIEMARAARLGQTVGAGLQIGQDVSAVRERVVKMLIPMMDGNCKEMLKDAEEITQYILTGAQPQRPDTDG